MIALGSLVSISAFAAKEKAATLNVDAGASTAQWLGKKVTGQHDGAIQLKNGSFTVAGNQITGGSFEIDMNSITCQDIKDSETNAKLIGHLKSEDFFNVGKFPTAKFVITKVTPLTDGSGGATHTVTGNLTVKDTTKPLSFPATINVTGDVVTAKADVVIDRTVFNIKYGSGKFFKGLGDKVISDTFNVALNIAAKK